MTAPAPPTPPPSPARSFKKPNKQYFKYTDETGKETFLENKQIQINSIKGGKHTYKITASLEKINWSDPVVIEIEKEISFGETAWLYITITAAALLLISVGSYFWVKRVKKKAIKRLGEEQQINLLKHQAMNALLSPHFIFNSLTSIQNYINTNNSLMASEYLAKFTRLIRMIIEKAAQSEISLKDEIVRLNYYLDLEKERFKNKFDFIIEVDLTATGYLAIARRFGHDIDADMHLTMEDTIDTLGKSFLGLSLGCMP